MKEQNQEKIETKTIKVRTVFNVINKKRKYYAIIVAKEQHSFTFLKKKRFRIPLDDSTFYIGKRGFPLKLENPSYIKGNKLFYFIDLEIGQLSYEKDFTTPLLLSPKEISMMFKKNLVAQLFQKIIGNKVGLPIVVFIIGCLMGGAFGYIFGSGGLNG